MSDAEIARLARLLASHALLLLALGIVLGSAAAAAVLLLFRLLARFRAELRSIVSSIVSVARRSDALDRLLARVTVLIPAGYVALHLALGLSVVAALMAFGVVAEEVFSGDEVAVFDVAFARELHATATPGWIRFFSIVSWLGSAPVLAAATGAVGIALIARKQVVLAVGFMGAQAGAGVLNYVLKAIFARTRPEFADPFLFNSSWSFPSGHAMSSFVWWGLGCYLVIRSLRSWTAAALAIIVTIAWCLTMSFSRLYLGVHYASDVVAGMCAGAAWVSVCISALEIVGRRRTDS